MQFHPAIIGRQFGDGGADRVCNRIDLILGAEMAPPTIPNDARACAS